LLVIVGKILKNGIKMNLEGTIVDSSGCLDKYQSISTKGNYSEFDEEIYNKTVPNLSAFMGILCSNKF